jgi:hypothetical protein
MQAASLQIDPITNKIYLPTADIDTVADTDPAKPLVRNLKADTLRVVVVERKSLGIICEVTRLK